MLNNMKIWLLNTFPTLLFMIGFVAVMAYGFYDFYRYSRNLDRAEKRFNYECKMAGGVVNWGQCWRKDVFIDLNQP